MSRGDARLHAGDPAVSAGRLWFGALAGHFAWTAQLLLTYFVVSLACTRPPAPFQVAGIDGYQFLLFALTLVPAAVALFATWVAYQAWRAARRNRQAEANGTLGWRGFLGLFGALLSGVFVATILLTGLSLLYLSPCPYY
jgi:hypothetical protein